MPALAYDDAIGVDLRRQLEFIVTSRGCPAACTFCASPRFWGKTLRFRSPRSVIDEIRSIRDRHGLLYFSLRDDTFTSDRERTLEFCRLLVQERLYILWNCQSRVSAVDEEMLFWMKRAGCECVQYGVESGSPVVLARLGKRIALADVRRAMAASRRAGIHPSIYLITGVPGENDDDLRQTLTLLDEIRPLDGQVSPLAYYPGTALFSQGVKSGAVGADLFRKGKEPAFFVRSDPLVDQTRQRLLARLEKVAASSSFTPEDFRRQKQLLGYCHATNIMAGELYAALGDVRAAEREYREIVGHEPANPWGWLALGELNAERGMLKQAEHAYERAAALVPNHVPAYESLGEICRLRGDRLAAERYYSRALSLDSTTVLAREGLARLQK
ncbi:MAG TPA: radical SAM protein [Geobacteraceae bacterium]